MTKVRTFAKGLACCATAVLATAWSSAAFGQLSLGVTPSQTGQFYDDFRAKALDTDRPTSSGDTSYQFHRGYYRALGPVDTAARDSPNGANGYQAPDSSYAPVDNYSHSQRYGREFGRYSGLSQARGSYFAPAYVTDPFSHGHNIKLGPIPVRLSARASAEWTDNLTRRGTDPLEEYILGFDVGMNGTYNVTRYNQLSLSLGLGASYYLNHPEFNGRGGEQWSLNIPLGSNISFDILVGDLLVRVYDRFSVSRQTQDDFALDDLDIFAQFNNDLGIATNYGINSYTNLTVAFNRADRIALDDEFSYLDTTNYSINASLAWSPTNIWTAGINASTTWVDYKERVQNDGDLYNIGLFFSSPITRSTSIRAGGGFQVFNFEEGGLNGDRSDLDDYYYNISLQNQLNARVSHSITFGHESSLATRSNFVTTDYIRYGVGVIGYRGSRISASVFYEQEESSGGLSREDYDRYGLDVYWGHHITTWLHMGFGYHYGVTESSLAERDYKQHSFSIDTSYPITADLNAGLGYRFWTVDADGDASDFDQNRVILNLTYHF